MSRLTIDMSAQQHQSLKAFATLQGKTIKQYALERLFPGDTDAAETDLRAIVRYTRTQWGEAQVRRYVAKLKVGMTSVAAGRGVFKPMDALYPQLRVAHC